MTTLNQWAVLVTLKNVENRSCCDCKVPLTKTEAFCSSYGIWVCSCCRDVHKGLVLVQKAWFRHALNDQLTEEEINFLLHRTCIATTGNAGFNELFERHIPSGWTKLTPNCSAKEREIWIKAKYSIELFRIPNARIGVEYASTLKLHRGAPAKKKKPKQRDAGPAVLPSRIVDYFLVVSAIANVPKLGDIPPKLESIATLPVVPVIQACYPPSESYPDMAMPELLAPFIFPSGVALSTVEKQPSFFTFVLTDVSGVKLYGAAMHAYELLEPLDLLPELGLPAGFASAVTSDTASKIWPVVYVPKALVVLSHYPFFHLYKEFLESLYHVSLSPSLLPLERYIINFFSETPLPPQGLVEVNFAVNPKKVVQVTRPRKNQLPMIDFSFRPLFMLLSVDNIVATVTALCSELPVCIISENVALLTPVCESLLSFLFPFTWQGAYIPVLPEHMTEILDAPVPYLMGLQRGYFDRHGMGDPANRPAQSVFVDLDNDTVYLGRAEDLFGADCGGDSELMSLQMPNSKLLSKLKPKLVEFGGCIHHCARYKEMVGQAGVAFPGNEHLVPLAGLTDLGTTGTGINIVHKDSSSRLSAGKRGSAFFKGSPGGALPPTPEAGGADVATRNVNTSGSQEYCTKLISSSSTPDIFDPQFNSHSPADGFNAQELRFAFLRMFVALLIDYQDFVVLPETDGAPAAEGRTATGQFASRPSFDRDRFLAHNSGDEFLNSLLGTQLFDKFMQEKLSSLDPANGAPVNMEVRYFDESILSKNNRSMIKFKKSSTPFLSDMSDAVAETYTTPTPNHWGVPLNAEPYTHNKFPTKLNASFLAPVRPPRVLVQEGTEVTRANDQGSKTANVISNTLMHRQNHAAEAEQDSGSSFGSEVALEVFLGEAQMVVLTVKKWVTQFQAIVRMRRQRKLFLARFAELKRLMNMVALKKRIANFVRMAVCRIRFRKCRGAVKRLQAVWRGARCYKVFRRTLVLVIRTQCCFRRFHVSKKQCAKNAGLVAAIRGHLVSMWHAGAVPLIERSRFWHFAGVLAGPEYARLVGRADSPKYRRYHCWYLALAVHVVEFNRMFSALGWAAREGGNRSSESSYASLAVRLGRADTMTSVAGAPAAAAGAARALATERDEMYKTMKSAMDDNNTGAKGALFAAFHLSATKKRKQALAQQLWAGVTPTDQKLCDVSARVVLKIQSTHDSSQYSAHKIDVTTAVPCLAAFVGVLRAVDRAAGAAAVPVEVSRDDQLWLLGCYCSRVARACSEEARLGVLAMAHLAAQARELRLREAECAALKASLFGGSGGAHGAHRRRRSSVSMGQGRKDSAGLLSREPSLDTRASFCKEGSFLNSPVPSGSKSAAARSVRHNM